MATTPKQTFMETTLVRLFAKMNQDLTKMEKISGENDDFKAIVEELLKQNMVKIHEKITEGFPESAISFEFADVFTPENHDGSTFYVTSLGAKTNLEHCQEDVYLAMAFQDHNGKLQDAYIFNPFTDQKFFASNSNGAFSENSRLRVSNRKESNDFVVFANKTQDNLKEFNKVTNFATQQMQNGNFPRITKAFLLDLIQVLAGKQDAVIATGVSTQDLAVAKLFVQEAGAVITDLQAKPLNEKTNSIIVANSKLHATIIKNINS